MSFFTDLFEGNFGNLAHDITSDPWAMGALGTAAVVGSAGFLAPEVFALEAGALGAGEAGLFGAAEAGGALGAGEAAGGGALAFGGSEAGLGISSGNAAIDSAFGGGAGLSGGTASAGGGALGGTGLPGIDQALTSGGVEQAFQGGEAGQIGKALGGDGGSFLGDLGKGAMKSVTNNPLGIAAAGGGLAMNLLKGNPNDPNRDKLQQQANQLGAQGEALQKYLADGTLPPALKAQLDNATNAAKARIISNHAKNGMPTDPSQNSALAQELNAVDMNAVAAMGQAQIDMMKTGLQETGLSTQLYEMLVKMDRQSNQDLMSAISSFASALGGGSKGVTLQMPKAA